MALTGDFGQFEEEIAANYLPISGKANVAASAFVEQIPRYEKEALSGTWTLVLITVHGGEDNKITLDFSSVNVGLTIDSDDVVVIDRQNTRLYQTVFQASTLDFVTEAQRFAEEYPKFDVVDLVDDLSTPDSENLNQLLDASGHACETMPQPSKYAHRRQTLYRWSQLRMDY